MKKILSFVLIAGILSCTNEDDSRDTLEAQGYTNIELTGYAWNRCAESDSTCTGFVAVGPTGLTVRGAVGCSRTGCGKGCTVRITHVDKGFTRDH